MNKGRIDVKDRVFGLLATPDDWRSFIEDEVIPHLRRQEVASQPKEARAWSSLCDELQLVADEDATSATAAGRVEEELEELRGVSDALGEALDYIHQSHGGLTTLDPKLCHHVECQRLQELRK